LRVQPEMGGILHLRLNTGGRPIANKYRERKSKSTLKRESKELEVVEREAIVTSTGRQRDDGGNSLNKSQHSSHWLEGGACPLLSVRAEPHAIFTMYQLA